MEKQNYTFSIAIDINSISYDEVVVMLGFARKVGTHNKVEV